MDRRAQARRRKDRKTKNRIARKKEQERIEVENYYKSKVSKEFLTRKILDIEKSRVWEDIDHNSYRLVFGRSSFEACTHPEKYWKVRVYDDPINYNLRQNELDALSDGYQNLSSGDAVFVASTPYKALLLGEEVDVVNIKYSHRYKDWFGNWKYRYAAERILLDNLCTREIPEHYQDSNSIFRIVK